MDETPGPLQPSFKAGPDIERCRCLDLAPISAGEGSYQVQMYGKVGHHSKHVPDPILARMHGLSGSASTHMHSCQVRPFSPSPKITGSTESERACLLPSGVYLTLAHTFPACVLGKSHNFIITTGLVLALALKLAASPALLCLNVLLT